MSVIFNEVLFTKSYGLFLSTDSPLISIIKRSTRADRVLNKGFAQVVPNGKKPNINKYD